MFGSAAPDPFCGHQEAAGAEHVVSDGLREPVATPSQGALTASFAGVTLAEAFVAAPFLIIAARSALAGIDTELDDVATTLGHPP
jgi:ABC-type sulfate transport system permease component